MKNRQRKIVLLLIKYSSTFIAVSYLLNTILMYFGIYSYILSWFTYTSILTIIIFWTLSWGLEFCIWHKLPWIYVLFVNIINLIDWSYYEISNRVLLMINLLFFGIIFVLCAYLKNRYNVRNNKTNTT